MKSISLATSSRSLPR